MTITAFVYGGIFGSLFVVPMWILSAAYLLRFRPFWGSGKQKGEVSQAPVASSAPVRHQYSSYSCFISSTCRPPRVASQTRLICLIMWLEK